VSIEDLSPPSTSSENRAAQGQAQARAGSGTLSGDRGLEGLRINGLVAERSEQAQQIRNQAQDETTRFKHELHELVEGRARFHNVFHYPADTWADVAIIQVFVDGAAMQTQGALRSCSYAPYSRVLKRICYEEDFHIQLGLDVWRALAEGTPAQRAMLQDALNRWWTPIIHFFGMPDKVSPHTEAMLAWRLKVKSNEELRQQFLRRFVPIILEYGLTVPDPGLRYVDAEQRYVYTEPDWDELKRVGRNGGPKSAERLALRQSFYRQHAWVREALGRWSAAAA